jgi:hypothetical protein
VATDGSVPCPDCGTPVRPDLQQLCPNCGYPLLLLRTPSQSEARAVPRAPGEGDDATALMTGTAPAYTARQPWTPGPEAPSGGQVDCPRCGYRNEAVRIRCEHCGQELRNARPPAMVLPPPEAVVFGRPRRKTWVIVLAVVAVVALVGLAAFAVARGVFSANRPGAQTPVTLVRVDPATVTASASSTIPQSRFRIQNTLDGDPQTVWDSDGAHLKSNVGVKLTFSFAQRVNLARITIVNGSARSAQNFAENQRAAQLRVHTDAGDTTWNLKDTVEPQSFTLKPAPTGSVTFVVEKVYLGTRWPDLVLTEVAFERSP